MDDTEVFISGGGVAGLTAAAALGAAGYRVVCVDPAPPVTREAEEGADLRTTAFLQPAVAVLRAAGLWERLAPFAAPLQIMRIVDAGGPGGAARVIKDFDASEISTEPFGQNLPNWLLRREMLARLADLPNVTFRPGVAATGLFTRSGEARVALSDGGTLRARLALAADGRGSALRQAAGIGVRTLRYGQKALSFVVRHAEPHQNVSTEVHRSGGPFTLVPLPDRDGAPCSAVVWMERGPEVARLAALVDTDFAAAATERSAGVLGPLALIGRRMVWPIISQLAERMAGERLALMAEAAHVVPPIGAQGLNMSLADLGCLLDLARKHDLGSEAMLDAYHRQRHPEVTARVLGVDALNRAAMQGAPPLRDLRAAALSALHRTVPLRKTLMKAGLGLA